MILRPNSRVLWCGKTQSGKTTKVKSLVPGIRNFLIYDVKRQYGAFGVVVRDLSQLLRAVRAGQTRLVFQPEDLGVDLFNEVCRFIYEHLRTVLFIIEEVQMFCSSSQMPPWFMKLITVCEGEPFYIGIWAITQMPVKVHWDFKSQASLIFSFRLAQKDAEDIQRVHGEIPAVDLVRLEKGEYIVYDDTAPFGRQLGRGRAF